MLISDVLQSPRCAFVGDSRATGVPGTERSGRRSFDQASGAVSWNTLSTGATRPTASERRSDPETDETLLSDWLTPRVDDLIETMGDNPGRRCDL
jgi:hypothetical protein